MQRMFLILILLLSSLHSMAAFAEGNRYVMVSFSMPDQLLEETLKDTANHQIPAVLNGLIDDSMPKTLQKIYGLSKRIPNLILQIDPTVFERFSIQKVPAFVLEKDQHFDVIYGNITVDRAFEEISRFGEVK